MEANLVEKNSKMEQKLLNREINSYSGVKTRKLNTDVKQSQITAFDSR